MEQLVKLWDVVDDYTGMLFGYASPRYLLLVAACAGLLVAALSLGGPAALAPALLAIGLLTAVVAATAPKD